MTAERRIIVSADDFGLCESVNLGILDCCAAGALSSVSIVSAGDAFRSGAEQIKNFPGVGKGVHLCLNDELPVLPPADIPGLVRNGRLLSYGEMLLRMAAGRLDPAEVYREWKAQIEAVLSIGISPDHLDSHNHVHLYPALFKVLVHLAEEYAIGSVRLPGPGALADGGLDAASAAKYLLSAGFAARSAGLELRSISHPASTRGYFRCGGADVGTLRRWAALGRPGEVAEIITHPGRGVSADCPRYSGWRYNWQAERDALLSFAGSGGWRATGASLCAYSALQVSPADTSAGARTITGLSVVIPACNERENIAKTLAITRRYLGKHASDWEILVVDDMSADGTGDEAARLLRGGNGRVIRTGARAGYGAALRAGFDGASKSRILYFDADYPAGIEYAAEAFRYSGTFDLVIGYRTNSWSEGVLRYVYHYAYGALIRLFFGLKVSDVNFAFKLFQKSAWERLGVSSSGSFIDAELLLKAERAGLTIKEIPVPLLARTFGRSRLANISNIAKVISEASACFMSGPGVSTLKRYTGAGLAARVHAVCRLLLCPVGKVERRLPRAGRILDFGCGIGVLSHMAVLSCPGRRMVGVDIDPGKITAARRFRGGEGAPDFSVSAAGAFPPGPYAAIVASDVLYLLDYGSQAEILASFYTNLAPGGCLLIKETDTHPRRKHWVNLAEETLAVGVFGFTKGRGIFVRGAESWLRMLAEAGFKASMIRLDRGYPHPHVLYEAVKPAL